MWTSLGLGPTFLRVKDRTRPDLQTLELNILYRDVRIVWSANSSFLRGVSIGMQTASGVVKALLARCVDDICMPPKYQCEADKWNRTSAFHGS